MLSASQLKRGILSPTLGARKLNKLYFEQSGRYNYNVAGINVFEEEWDNLLILDACRFDLFEGQSRIEGTLEKKVSRGSSTTEFLAGNFAGRQLHDVVYVTANPQFYRHCDTIDCELHDIINVWMMDGWDDEHGTVLPETVTKYALDAASKYDDKRLVIHYLQPHYPFLDSETEFDKGQLEDPDDDAAFWRRIMTGKLSIDTDHLWNLYERNLDRVLDSASDLIEALNGRTVVTSDHGNMLGERAFPIPIREWGHPRGIHTPELVEVPWLDCYGERRETMAESPVEPTYDRAAESVTERLRDLGYV